MPNATQATFSTHCHDDLGLAVANTLAAVTAGARQVECTINGVGERAGNASLEEIVMATRVRADSLPYDTAINTREIFPASQLLSALTGENVQANKAIVGRNAFAHEAGIHQDGMLKDRRTYEIMRPEEVGVPQATLVLGKHSGRHAVQRRCEQLGVTLERQELDQVYRAVIAHADREKIVSDRDLVGDRRAPARRRQASGRVGSGTTSRRPPPRVATGTGSSHLGSGLGIGASSAAKPEPCRPDRAIPDPWIAHIESPCERRPSFFFQATALGLRSLRRPRRFSARSRHGSATPSSYPRRSSARAALRRDLPPLPEATLAAAGRADAILLGAVGDPAFDAGPRQAGRKRRCSGSARRSDSTRTCGRPGCGRASRTPGRSSRRCWRAPTCSSSAS